MANLTLISCGRKKRSYESEAQYLYSSPRFRKTRDYAVLQGDPWFILSGKYGLVSPTTWIAPYDQSLKHVTNIEREKWAKNVILCLKSHIAEGDTVTIFAGEAYRKYLVPALVDLGVSVKVPLRGSSMGRQVQWLNTHLKQNFSDLNRFYDILADLEHGLGGKRKLSDCTGKLDWPKKGVYFFFEDGENRQVLPVKQRVVRVGTHAVSLGSTSTLWGRLRAHKGLSDGGGNHRGSIFRLHVGEALINKEKLDKFDSWGKGMFAPPEIQSSERELEVRVSKLICEMPLLWVNVDDLSGPSSDRAYIEKNAIALLSNVERPLDPPNKNWLGNFSKRESISSSGLWNIQHTKARYDPRFLDVLAHYVDVTLGRKANSSKAIAPLWHKSDINKMKGVQAKIDSFGDKYERNR